MTARVLNFTSGIYLAALLFILSFLSDFFVKSKNIGMIVLVFGSALVIYFVGQDLIRSLVGIASALVPVCLSRVYLDKK